MGCGCGWEHKGKMPCDIYEVCWSAFGGEGVEEENRGSSGRCGGGGVCSLSLSVLARGRSIVNIS